MQQPPQGGFLMEKLPMKRKNKKQIIGIIGGMGPEASNYLYKTLIDLSIKYFGAKNNDDFPEILLDSIPISDFIADDSKKKEALKILKDRVVFLNKAKPSYLAIACNTVHILLDELQKKSKAPFISIIEEVANSVHKSDLRKIGILGTPLTIKSRLYHKALYRFEIEVIEPTKSELKILEKIIRNVITDSSSNKDKTSLVYMANALRDRGAEGIILGCTELPLIFPKKQSFPVFNSLEILAMVLLQKYYKQNTI